MWTPNPGGMPPPKAPPGSSRHPAGMPPGVQGRPLPPQPNQKHPNMFYNQAYDQHHPTPVHHVPSGPPSSGNSSNASSSSGTALAPNNGGSDQVDGVSVSSKRHKSPGRRNRRMAPNPGEGGSSSSSSSKHRVFADPAEMIVIDYADGAHLSPRATPISTPTITTSTHKPPVYRHPPPQPVLMLPQRPPVSHLHQQDMQPTGEVSIPGRIGHAQQSPAGGGGAFYHHQHHQFHQHLEGSHHQMLAAGNHYQGGGHYSPDHSYFHQQQQHHQQNLATKNSNRSSRSSDTSSAYSGSDTMQSMHSSLENDPVDLSGLHESVVDSDEDLADSMDSLAIRDVVRDCLEKDPADRSPDDIEVLLEFSQQLPAFCNMTLATRRALCAVMVFAVVEKAGTVVMNDREELDSWSVIINGEVRIDQQQGQGQPKVAARFLKWGDAFGITPTMEKLYHQGVMKTCQDDCQFVCITQTDYYKILNEELTNQRRFEEEGKTVLVTEPDANGKVGHKVIRGTPDRLLSQLIDENSTADPTYVEDFLLTHRTFIDSSWKVAEKLLEWFQEGKLCDRVTRVLLFWVHNHFTDFEMDPHMMDFLESFERALEAKKMNGQLRMLNFTCAEKARRRIVTLTRPSREEPLHFSLMGGYERGFGIFVDRVEKNSKAAEIGLKRGDQILEVNRQSFEHNMTLQRALTFFKEGTHLQICVKSNLLAIGDEEKYKAPIGVPKQKKASKKVKVHSTLFKEMLQTPENSPRSRIRKASDITGLRSSATEYDVTNNKKKPNQDENSLTLRSTRSTSSLPASALSGKERVKAVLRGLIKPKIPYPVLNSDADMPTLLGVNSDTTSSDTWDFPSDIPEHSLKIFKADQHFRYLLVHQNTTARDVVMLALQEFGISECSLNFTLCEVTVEGGFVRQKRLPDDQTNLAERIGLASRYYIKNIHTSDQLIPEDAKNELTKESVVNLLQLNPIEAAMQLMVDDFTVFRMIEPTEYIDHLFEIDSKFGTPNLKRFGELVNTEMMWVITEIVSEQNISRRAKIIKQFIKIAHHCYKETQNYNSMFAISSGLDHGAVKRLRGTWEKVPAKYLKLLEEMQNLMDPSMNFRKYRNLVSNARHPFIPIYPMVSKDLTFIHLGNETLIEGLINFEKLRMLAKEIRFLTNMCSAPLDLLRMFEGQVGADLTDAMRKMNPPAHQATMKRGTKKTKEALNAKKMYEEAQMVRRVKAYLSKMPVIVDEEALHKMSLEVEPPPHSSSNAQQQSAVAQTSERADRSKTLSAQNSTASVNSAGVKSRRGTSPTPSVGSTTSSTSHQSHNSEGRKSTASGTKFGTDSPQAVRKLMALSDPAKARRHQPKHSVSSLNSNTSPKPSPNTGRKTLGSSNSNSVSLSAISSKHERSQSDVTFKVKSDSSKVKVEVPKVSLSKESSSVTSLPALRKGGNSTSSVGNSESSQRHSRNDQMHHFSSNSALLSSAAITVHKIPKAKLGGRTLSRERKNPKTKGDDGESQVSAV